MYLEKLEIQGFKSFANKNVLVFPGILDGTRRGLTAVVGPNGSGKSNLSDAVRWVMGEQSMKTLRGKKFEDVIFSGSDKRSGLGMSEVSMTLNNEDRQAPVDYSQLVITRRLFKNGESEYLMNGSRVRLSDIQMLLIRANFGQKTYSVIGQGMVEGFLNTSLAERKEFFDEATGVKQFQLKRDDALNKLRQSFDNLGQAEMLLSEIEPRLRSLTRQVGKLHRRHEIEADLRTRQRDHYSRLWQELDRKFRETTGRFLELERNKMDKDKKLASLNNELARLEADRQDSDDFQAAQASLLSLQQQKDALVRQLARLEASAEARLEASGRFDLSWLYQRRQTLAADLTRLEQAIAEARTAIEARERSAAELGRTRAELESGIAAINGSLEKLSRDAAGGPTRLSERLAAIRDRLWSVREAADIEVFKTTIANALQDLESLIEEFSASAAEETETGRRELIALGRQRDELLAEISRGQGEAAGLSERLRILTAQKEAAAAEDRETGLKIAGFEQPAADGDNGQRKAVEDGLQAVERELDSARSRLNDLNAAAETKHNRIFSLQKNTQALQVELNELNSTLNELKIASTRYETRLEDLEVEIRQAYGELADIRTHRTEGEPEPDALDKINALRKQLELIGGIDPEAEKEYEETKTRFEYLSGQVADLNSAIESLEKIVRELDETIKERFDREFSVIAKKFDEYFRILFNGGQGKVIKVMDDQKDELAIEGEPAEADADEGGPAESAAAKSLKRIKYLQKYNATGLAGVEIAANPPGKKIKSIAMLSGGERALTAIALICAIISSNPSPFVFLDEVDAALDEANSERLARILDDLSHKTQFVVITHNRATMRRANILYGVTMGDDGASRLLSVKFDDAAELAQ